MILLFPFASSRVPAWPTAGRQVDPRPAMVRVSESHRAVTLAPQPLKKGRHIAVRAFLQHVKRLGGESVNAGVDVCSGDRFLLEANDINALRLYDAKRMSPFVNAHGHCCGCILTIVKVDQFAVSNVSDDVAVVTTNVELGRGVSKANAPAVPSGRIFPQIVYLYA